MMKTLLVLGVLVSALTVLLCGLWVGVALLAELRQKG